MPSILSLHVALLHFPCRWSRLRPPLGSCSCCGRRMESLGIDPPWWHGDTVHRWRRLDVKKMETQSGKIHMIWNFAMDFINLINFYGIHMIWETGHEFLQTQTVFSAVFPLPSHFQPADCNWGLPQLWVAFSGVGNDATTQQCTANVWFSQSQILLLFVVNHIQGYKLGWNMMK